VLQGKHENESLGLTTKEGKLCSYIFKCINCKGCQEYSMKYIYSTSQMSKLSLTLRTFSVTGSVAGLFLTKETIKQTVIPVILRCRFLFLLFPFSFQFICCLFLNVHSYKVVTIDCHHALHYKLLI